MKPLKIAMFSATLMLFSSAVSADFNFTGQAKLHAVDGQASTIPFGFSFLKAAEGYIFSLGEHQMEVEEVPKRFTLALVLNEQNQVWVTDFSKSPLHGFDWNIAPHSIQLVKQHDLVPKRPGDYTLLINGTRYHFTEKKRGLIHFNFNEKGIDTITVEAMVMPKR
jgi:hypothetical protein